MHRAGRIIPPLALMGLIFYLSSRPNLGTGLGAWDTVLRKGAHMTAFGLLWFLVWRAFQYRWGVVAAVITVAYAISDELHQRWVPGRNGAVRDVMFDAAGMALAILAVRWWRARDAHRPPG